MPAAGGSTGRRRRPTCAQRGSAVILSARACGQPAPVCALVSLAVAARRGLLTPQRGAQMAPQRAPGSSEQASPLLCADKPWTSLRHHRRRLAATTPLAWAAASRTPRRRAGDTKNEVVADRMPSTLTEPFWLCRVGASVESSQHTGWYASRPLPPFERRRSHQQKWCSHQRRRPAAPDGGAAGCHGVACGHAVHVPA